MILTINEQNHELHFGMKALETFYEKAPISNSGNVSYTDQVTAIIWGGIKNEAYRKERSLNITFADVCDWVDANAFTDEGKKIITEIVSEFSNSQALKSAAGNAEGKGETEGNVKKKQKLPTLTPA